MRIEGYAIVSIRQNDEEKTATCYHFYPEGELPPEIIESARMKKAVLVIEEDE